MKYILTNNNCFAIFSETATHIDMAMGMWGKPISAGFCRRHANGIYCYGESISLNLKSRPEDSEIITKLIEENK